MRSYTLFLMILSGFTMSIGFAQDVPQNVEDAFKQNFALASNVSWEMEDDNWEAEFKQNGKEMSAVFSANAEWIETEWELEKEEVPANIMDAVTQKYGDAEIDEQNKIENENGTFYEFEIEGEDGSIEALFDDQGNFVSEEHEDDENDQGEMEDDDN